ncbi:Similar to Eukaryotic translation initiation factor 3 subunit A; acc. no. A4II09 [Pyronema omphalodes CBS 100304]|uniref:Similar to Eukaryotic translation initiation factor 3 subunit A acc. no. A4II09 n=1 Tax=Pyronema omphalodes (strain CBS 100304) TaxID=1076935 RepID=U4LGB5_PYROM|nr:Similar to Eukaryotic translation initiation factor 3 subunit A; acc. no. A4II09 [Pyronema omphalodes CBS 100304]
METSTWTYKSPGSQYNGLKLSDFIKIAEYRNINFNPRITGEKFVTKIESDDSWRRKLGQPWGLKASPFSERTGPRTKWAPRKEDRDNKDKSSESSERPSNGNFFEGRRYDTGLPARPRHSTGFPDREGSERSFDRPERPYSAYRQENSGPRELNPERQSSDRREYNSDRPPREGFNSDRPPRREYNSDRPPREGFNSDRPPRREYNSDRPPRREYNSDRPYTPRDFNSDRPQHYPSRDFSRPAYDPTNRPSYNSDRPSKYFSPNSSRPHDSSGERSLNRTSNPNSSERSLKLSSSPPSSDPDSSSAAQGSQSSQDDSNSSPSESSERTPQLDPHQRFSYQGTGQRSYPPHRPNPYARDFPDGQSKKPWSPMVRPLPRGLQKWQKQELAWTPRGEWTDKMDRYRGDKDRGYGGDRDRRDRKKGEWKF